ncbi:DNA topoisomerase 2-like isoform X2 [Cornus florida]|nr:DNA topoisomerase 2-like isoform X2 [Cornus florida]
MAHDYLGTNNINLLEPNALSRYLGGKDHDAVPTYRYTRLSPITQYLFPKDDDILLEYIKEDGNSVEPSWYMPIIPMVLVNGTEVIVTGDRSYIPKYNPMDIVSNLRCLLNEKPMQPMQPWYKGFRGNIKKAAADGYTIEGLIEEVDATTLRITKLPIGVSRQDYIDFLRSMTTGNDPFIKYYIKRNADDTTVNFEVILPAENLSMAKHEGLLKKFKLTTTIKTSNMCLFNREGMIKKYDTPIQILEEFIPIRLEFYEKRKKYVLCNLEMELLKLENKVKYVTEVLEGKISFFQGTLIVW